MQFTPEQQNAITAMRPLVCVSAGAGSGKTTILIERIAHILATEELWPEGAPQLDRIAAITFTDKAAAEMKARLRRKFKERPTQTNSQVTSFWRDMERQVETARITTIHSFCASLLREYALHIGMDPDWGAMTDAESAQLTEQVIDECLFELLEAGDAAAENLSVCFSRTNLKQALTDVLGERWKYQKPETEEIYSDPETLLTHWITLADASFEKTICALREAGAIREHLDALECYHGCCANPQDRREVQRDMYAVLFSDMEAGAGDLSEKITRTLEQSDFRGGSKKVWGEEAYAEVGDALKAAKAFLKEECQMPETDPAFEKDAAKLTSDFYQVSKAVIAAYAQARQERAAIDFDDMISETLIMLRDNDALRKHAAQSFRFLLIDEFQDTDTRQLDIAHLLAVEEGGPDLFIVGDAKQSIYLFRGAEVSLFKAELVRDPESIALPVNYRSLPDVICFINDFFKKSCLLAAVEDYAPMEPFRAPMNAARVELFVPDWDDPDVKEPVSRNNEREAQFIARRIREMCSDSEALQLAGSEPGTFRSATYDDIVLLFRRGSHIYAYESALREEGIPYNRIAGEGYFKRREIQDMLALLKLIQDPWDEEALLTVLRSPLAVLSDESLMRMAQLPGGLATTFHGEEIPERFDETEAFQKARTLFKELYAIREIPPYEMVRIILDKTNIEAVLLSQHLGLQRVSNLRKLLQLANDFSQGRPATLAEFTHYLEDIRVREIREGEAMLQAKGMGAVTLMTIHKSKGLEFPVVFLPEMWARTPGSTHDLVLHHDSLDFTVKTPDDTGEQKFNAIGELIKRLRKQEEAAESARLLYVAMTRARDYLVLCGHAQPKKDNWAATLNEVYNLEGMTDNTVIKGAQWQAILRRTVPEAVPAMKEVIETPSFDLGAIHAAIMPPQIDSTARESISVSRLLTLMAKDELLDADIEPEPLADILENETETIHVAREEAKLRGTLAHRMFELWEFRNDRLPDLDALISEAGLGLKKRDSLKEELRQMADRFRASDCMKRFAEADVIRTETPFVLLVGDVLVHGVIDALIDDALIVDYKTGNRNQEQERHYEDQLLLYAAALRNITGKMPEKAMLWYADRGAAHTIEIADDKVDEVFARARAALEQGTSS